MSEFIEKQFLVRLKTDLSDDEIENNIYEAFKKDILNEQEIKIIPHDEECIYDDEFNLDDMDAE